MTCRKCEAPAVDVRRDWDNEGAEFTYVHADVREHRVRVLAIDAQQVADEELRQAASHSLDCLPPGRREAAVRRSDICNTQGKKGWKWRSSIRDWLRAKFTLR
jgi:hypothetical protein